MGKYVDWYLVELEGCLAGRLGPQEINDLVVQAEAHLLESAAELVAGGMSEKDGELAALKRFGKARRIADEAAPVIGSWGQLAAIGSYALFGALLTWFACGSSRFGFGPAYETLTLAACVILFSVSALYAKRVLWKELGFATAIGLVAISFYFGKQFSAVMLASREDVSKYSQEMKTQSDGISSQMNALSADMAKFKSNPPVAKLEQIKGSDGQLFMTARIDPDYSYPAKILANESHTGLLIPDRIRYEKTKSSDVASKGWASAPGYLLKLDESRQLTQGFGRQLETWANSSILVSAWSHLGKVSLYCAGWLVAGLGLNILCFSLGLLSPSYNAMRKTYA